MWFQVRLIVVLVVLGEDPIMVGSRGAKDGGQSIRTIFIAHDKLRLGPVLRVESR